MSAPAPHTEASFQLWTRREYGKLLLATIGIAFAFVRLLVLPLKMPALIVPVVLLLAWFLWRLSQPRALIQSPVGWPLLVFSLATVVSSFQGIASGYHIVAVLFFWGGMVGCPLFLAVEMMAWGWHPRIITSAVLLTISLLLIYAVGETFIFWVDWWRQWQPGTSLLPPFQDHDFIAMSHPNAVTPFTIGIPLVIAAMWQARTRWFQVVGGIWLFWAVIVIFYTSARGGWLSLVISVGGMLAFLLWSAYRTRQYLWRAVGAVALAGCYAALFLSLFIGNYLPTVLNPSPKVVVAEPVAGATAVPPVVAPSPSPQKTDETLNETVDDTFKHLANPMGRWTFWKRAIQIFAEHPLFGAGPAGYMVRYKEIEPTSKNFLPHHPHNTYLAVLSELGLTGAIGFLWLCLLILVVWWRGLRASTPWSEEWFLTVACGAIGVVMVVDSVFSVSPPQNGLLALCAMAAGLAAGSMWKLSPTTVQRTAGETVTAPDTLRSVVSRFRASAHAPQPLHVAIMVSTILAWGVATLVLILG